MNKKLLIILLLAGFVLVVLSIFFIPQNEIERRVIGKIITFYDIGGNPRNYIVTRNAIRSIDIITDCPKNRVSCYRVDIDGMWHIFYDKDTLEELGVKQLFIT